jgi:hypothetical protein
MQLYRYIVFPSKIHLINIQKFSFYLKVNTLSLHYKDQD